MIFAEGKKKEVKKETGLGLSHKKDENFGEWYSEVRVRRHFNLVYLCLRSLGFKCLFNYEIPNVWFFCICKIWRQGVIFVVEIVCFV